MSGGLIDGDDRLRLSEMIGQSGASNYTDEIRERRHAQPLRKDASRIRALVEEKADVERVRKECPFMAVRYPDVLVRLAAGDMSVDLFERLIDCIGLVEEGLADQHEASVLVGKALKDLYIDGIARADKPTVDTRRSASKDLSYADYIEGRLH